MGDLNSEKNGLKFEYMKIESVDNIDYTKIYTKLCDEIGIRFRLKPEQIDDIKNLQKNSSNLIGKISNF